MSGDLFQKLAQRSISREELLEHVRLHHELVPSLKDGTDSPKASVRYGCAKVLIDLSEEHPETMYEYMDRFIAMLDSRHRILTWNALAIVANLARVDKNNRIEAILHKYYGFLNNEYMVTVANVVGNSGKIALAKPHLIQKITDELLKVEDIKTTPHLTEECERVIVQKTIETLDLYFDKVEQKSRVISFVKRQLNTPRKSLKKQAETFLQKWDQTAAHAKSQ